MNHAITDFSSLHLHYLLRGLLCELVNPLQHSYLLYHQCLVALEESGITKIDEEYKGSRHKKPLKIHHKISP